MNSFQLLKKTTTKIVPIVATAWVLLLGAESHALPDLMVNVQPIQIRETSGLNPAPVILNENELDSIFGQANIDIFLEPVVVFDNTLFRSFAFSDNTTLFDLFLTPGHGQNSDPLTLNLWFSDDTNLFGVGNALVDANGSVVDGAFLQSAPIIASSVVAKMLGHNLGLGNLQSPGNLMNPVFFPSGPAAVSLNQMQIDLIRLSDFAQPIPAAAPVPEPGTLILLGTGLLGLIGAGKKMTPTPFAR